MRPGSVTRISDDALKAFGFKGILGYIGESPGVFVLSMPSEFLKRAAESYKEAARGSADKGLKLLADAMMDLIGAFENAPDSSRALGIVTKIYEMASILGEGIERLFAEALRAVGDYYAEAVALNAHKGLPVLSAKELGVVAVKGEGGVEPAYGISYQNIRERFAGLQGDSAVVVVTCPFDAEGRPMVPEDGWADAVAVLIASSLGLKAVKVLVPEPQIASAERGIVKGAGVIEKLSYSEAMEISSFYPSLMGKGALVLAEAHEISIRFSDMRGRGTLISGERSVSSHVIKCVAAKGSLGIVTVKGRNLVGLLPHLISELTGAGVRINTLTLSTSGTEVSLVLSKDEINACRKIVEFKFMGRGVDDYRVSKDVCAISVIGEGMKGTPGIASRLFGSVAKRGINIIMIMQGSSELNIGFIVEEGACKDAVNAVYEEFMH